MGVSLYLSSLDMFFALYSRIQFISGFGKGFRQSADVEFIRLLADNIKKASRISLDQTRTRSFLNHDLKNQAPVCSSRLGRIK